MDRLLKRTFLFLCPVEIYRSLSTEKCFSCLELCVTLRKVLPDTKDSYAYTKDFVNTNKMTLIMLGTRATMLRQEKNDIEKISMKPNKH